MTQRTLKRPPEGWAARPNAELPPLIMAVVLCFGAALFFRWTASAIDLLVTVTPQM